jgi:hypothetical protein
MRQLPWLCHPAVQLTASIHTLLKVSAHLVLLKQLLLLLLRSRVEDGSAGKISPCHTDA